VRKYLEVKQQNSKDCGASSLLSIIRHYNGNISLEKLIDMTNTNKYGTSLYHLKNVAIELGFSSECYKIPDKKISKKIICPAICHVKINNYEHFVVLYKYSHDKVLIMDPAVGFKKITTVQFESIWTGNIMILIPNKKIPYIKDQNYIKKMILDLLLHNKKILINISVLSVIFTLFTFLYTFFLKIIIDGITEDKNIIITISLIFLAIGSVKITSDYFRRQLLIHLNQKLDINIFLDTFKHVISLPYQYYKNKTTGDIVSRINDISYIRNFVSKLAMTIFIDILLVFFGIIILLSLNQKLFLISLASVLLYILVFILTKRIVERSTKDIEIDSGLVNSYLTETIGGFETIRSLNAEEEITKKLMFKYGCFQNKLFKFENLDNNIEFIKNLIECFSFIAIIYVGINEVIMGNMTLGTLITYNSLLTYFTEPIKIFLNMNIEYFFAKNSIKRVGELFDIQKEDIKSEKHLSPSGDIVIKNLDFSYNNYNKIIDDLSLKIKKNEKVLILGPSGGGKSTLLKIIYKYLNIKREMLEINNIDINDFTIKDIRKNIIYISQNETLFTDTIYNNITLKKEVDYEYFLKICKLVKVDEIVKDKVLGYDTILEENGVNISGGQKQRIILARSLIQDGDIILIDEALNALDINLERSILKSIFRFFKKKTFIIVSHRVENEDLYDKVVIMENGQAITNYKNKGGIYG